MWTVYIGLLQFKTGLRNMVVISNLYLNASKKEFTIVSNNFQHIMASTKHFIIFPKDNFYANSLIQERNLNTYKY